MTIKTDDKHAMQSAVVVFAYLSMLPKNKGENMYRYSTICLSKHALVQGTNFALFVH